MAFPTQRHKILSWGVPYLPAFDVLNMVDLQILDAVACLALVSVSDQNRVAKLNPANILVFPAPFAILKLLAWLVHDFPKSKKPMHTYCGRTACAAGVHERFPFSVHLPQFAGSLYNITKKAG